MTRFGDSFARVNSGFMMKPERKTNRVNESAYASMSGNGLLVVGEQRAKLTEDQTVEAIDALYGSWPAETRPDPNSNTPYLMLGPLIVAHLKVAQDLLYQLTDATGRPTTEIMGDIVTGVIENRFPRFRVTMSRSSGAARISSTVTIRSNFRSGAMSTMYQTGLSGVLFASGCSELGSQAVWSG